MHDITEQRELAQDISDAISKPVGFGEEFDDVSSRFTVLFPAFAFVWIQLFSSATLDKLLSIFSLTSIFHHHLDFLMVAFIRCCVI